MKVILKFQDVLEIVNDGLLALEEKEEEGKGREGGERGEGEEGGEE